jgi:aryl-alcohol dehydrogenase-like predicted oxidoreductase
MQPPYNLIYREEEREMLPLCQDQGVGVIPWSPLGRGVLARAEPPSDGDGTTRVRTDDFMRKIKLGQSIDKSVLEALRAVAGERGVQPAQIALAWLLTKPAVTAPIIGASKLAHLDDTIAAIDIQLNEEEIQRLEAPYVPHPIVGHN